MNKRRKCRRSVKRKYRMTGEDEVLLSQNWIKINNTPVAIQRRKSIFTETEITEENAFKLFEREREYRNYFPKMNLDVVISRMENTEF